MKNILEVYHIHRDCGYKKEYVVFRNWYNEEINMQPVAVVDTLEEARERIPRYFSRVSRLPEEIKTLVETWVE